MRPTLWRLSCLAVPFVLSLLPTSAGVAAEAAEWPQWRGPRRDGVWREPALQSRFAAERLAARWTANIGAGYSGPAVADGRTFVTDRPAGKEVERVLVFDAATGNLLWQHEWPANYQDLDYASGPRATPTVDGSRVYVKGATGVLKCLNVKDGAVVWQRDLVADFKARVPVWGMVGAPLVDGDSVLVNVGGKPSAAIIAFDKRTGKVRWQKLDDRPGYAPPTIIEHGGIRQLLYWSAEALNALDPATGESYWRIPFKDRADMTICSPVLHDDHLFVSSYYGGSLMLQLGSQRPSAEVVWRDERGKPATLALCISTPILKGEHLYGVDRSGVLKCLEISSGKAVWTTSKATGTENHANAHIIQYGDRELLFNEAGELILAELSPEGYRELSRTQVIDPTAGVADHRAVDWSHPAFALGHIFVRNDGELRCIPLAGR